MIGKIVRWLVVIGIAGATGTGLYLFYLDTLPCTHPVTYTIGAVDPRFDISETALLKNIDTAAAIWNAAAGKTVLVYDPQGEMPINLVYDSRAANAKFGSEIARQQAATDTQRAALDALQAQYVAKLSAYNDEVAAVNARGGATRSEAISLSAEQDALNAFSNSINSQVSDFNKNIAHLNALVAEFNKSAGYTFEEGQYVRDADGERINIFEFVGMLQLERVLAHELGHALGLDHNSDPKSIMFAKNESGNLVPTTADLEALKAVCGL